MKPTAVIFDIDGTLSNQKARIHYFEKDFQKYMEHAIEDPPHQWAQVTIQALHAFGVSILLVSGRTENYRDLTDQWLTKHDIPYTELFLKQFRCERVKGPEFKKKVYQEQIEPCYNVFCAVEDDSRLVEVYRELGVVCLDCGTWSI